MAKNNISVQANSIVTLLRNQKLARGGKLGIKQNNANTAAKTILQAFLDSKVTKLTPPLVAISTKTNKILTIEEVEDLEKAMVGTIKNSVEDYILVSKEKAISYIKSLNATDAVKESLSREIGSKARAWNAFSAVLTKVHGGGPSDYVRELTSYKPEAIIKLENMVDKSNFLRLIKAHYTNYNRSIKEQNSRFAVTNSGRFIVITDDKPVKTGYKVKVKGKYNDLTNTDFWEISSIGGPYLSLSNAVGDPKDIAHFRLADQTLKSMTLLQYLEEAKQLLDSNTEADLEKTIDDLIVIANQKIEDAKGASMIIGGRLVQGRTGRSSSNPVVAAARKAGVVIKGNDILLPVVYEDDKTFDILAGSAVITSTASWAFDIVQDNNGVLYTAANRAFNQGLQRAMEVASSDELVTIVKKAIVDPGSLSIVATLLGSSLAKIFDDKKLQQYVNTNKSKKSKKRKSFLPIGKKGKRINTKIPPPARYSKSILARSIPNFKKTIAKGTTYLGDINFPENSTNALLSIINANLRQEVIAQMKYPALINRTGRFAGSVRIIDIVNSQVNATFMKSPYSVFMQQGGKSPWSTVDRDPVKIINEAISSISSKYNLGISKVNVR